MRGDLVRRGAAIGVAIGLAAAAETVRSTPALRADPAGALELSALFVWLYAAAGLALVLVLGVLGRGDRLAAARLLWPLAGLAIAFAAWNEAARSSDALAPWRHVGRAAIALAAIAVVCARRRFAASGGRGNAPPRSGARRAARAGRARRRRVSRCVRCRAAPRRPTPEAVLALAPRFAPEPPAVFAHTRDAGRPRVLLIGVDGASWDRVERGIARGAPAHLRPARRERRRRPAALRGADLLAASLDLDRDRRRARPRTASSTFYLYAAPAPRHREPRACPEPRTRARGARRTGELRFVPATSSLRRRKALWNLADEAGLSSAVIGLWATWPPEALRNGVVVSDHASLARQQEWLDRGKSSGESRVTTWPPALAASLAALQRAPDSVTREELAELRRARRRDVARLRVGARTSRRTSGSRRSGRAI